MAKTKSKPQLKWFAVKTLYRSTPEGRPTRRDQALNHDITLIEERIVLFRAISPDDAIKQAEGEAKSYSKLRTTNPYGQLVRTRYLKACESFELFDSPGEGTEVFSTTEIVSKRTKDSTIIDRRFGPVVDEDLDQLHRRNIRDSRFTGLLPDRDD